MEKNLNPGQELLGRLNTIVLPIAIVSTIGTDAV